MTRPIAARPTAGSAKTRAGKTRGAPKKKRRDAAPYGRTVRTAPADSASAAGLVYVADETPGFRRIRSGRSFRYVNANGKAPGREHLRRIRSLVIPPAWTDVWICPRADGHLQATGRDSRGRKQHRYHPLWRDVRDANKYDRLIEFARTLSRIRRKVSGDLASKGLGRERVLAAIVRLMDLTFLRVGNEEYARQNNSYGLTTLKDQHAAVRGGTIRFRFRGKSGKHHEVELSDPRLARIVKGCQDIPGQDLFQYYDDSGEHHDVTSRDVNDYLRSAAGSDYTARDFRTWAGTVLAMAALQQRICTTAGEAATAGDHATAADRATAGDKKKNLIEVVREVAGRLGNTAAVCRRCYIHPFVLNGYAEGRLPAGGATSTTVTHARATSLGPAEKIVLKFLVCCQRDERARSRKTREKARRKGVPRTWQAAA